MGVSLATRGISVAVTITPTKAACGESSKIIAVLVGGGGVPVSVGVKVGREVKVIDGVSV